ncbi:MAG TPA: hypothetical protein VF228_16325, partial [Iamia sp.]
MLSRLAHLTVRRRVLVLVLAVVGFVLAGAIGGGVAEHLSSGGFDDPASESSRAEEALEDTFGTGAPNILLLVTADEGTDVDSLALAASAEEVVAELAAQPDIDEVASYWTLGRPPP